MEGAELIDHQDLECLESIGHLEGIEWVISKEEEREEVLRKEKENEEEMNSSEEVVVVAEAVAVMVEEIMVVLRKNLGDVIDMMITIDRIKEQVDMDKIMIHKHMENVVTMDIIKDKRIIMEVKKDMENIISNTTVKDTINKDMGKMEIHIMDMKAKMHRHITKKMAVNTTINTTVLLLQKVKLQL